MIDYNDEEISNENLIEIAKSLAFDRCIDGRTTIGHVAVALVAEDNKIYTGLSIEVTCSLGCCAEMLAIGESLKHGNKRIKKIIAFHEKKGIVSPCGKCREFIYQVNHENIKCEVLLKNRVCLLEDLLPEYG